MKLQNINLRNVYNFGITGTPELSDLKQFNLLIGKNGSGKSNVLRAICHLKIDDTHNPNSLHHEIKRRSNIYDVMKGCPLVRECNVNLTFNDHEIEFKDSQHIKGDISSYSGIYLNTDISEDTFKQRSLKLNKDNPHTAILNFAIAYIFNLEIEVTSEGITETFTRNKKGGRVGSGISNINSWASGFLSVSNLLMGFLLAEKSIICIDEPEVHIEPRVLKRVMIILFWLSTRDIDAEGKDTFRNIHDDWNNWLYSRHYGNSFVWKDKNGIIDFKARQLFIATHSSVLINKFLKKSQLCATYEFYQEYEFSNTTSGFDNSGNIDEDFKHYSLIHKTKKIEEYPHSILDNLGASGSDILQANGIIWVEGPSDVIYIRKWLELYALENSFPTLSQGNDYEFQMFGGTLLDSLCLIKDGLSEDDELKKVVSMFSFSRNAFVITDSDAVYNDKKEIVDQSKFKNAKEFIAKAFDEKIGHGFNLGIWYKNNNIDIRTLENYLDDKTLSEVKGKSYSKKIYAERCVEYWGNTKSLSDFKHNLKDEIEILYNLINKWNE